jgi:hypothetical protein
MAFSAGPEAGVPATYTAPPASSRSAPRNDVEEKYQHVKESFYQTYIEGAAEGMREAVHQVKTRTWDRMRIKLEDQKFVEAFIKPARLQEKWVAALAGGLVLCKTDILEDDFRFSDELNQLFVSTLRYLYEDCAWDNRPRPDTFEAFEKEVDLQASNMFARILF